VIPGWPLGVAGLTGWVMRPYPAAPSIASPPPDRTAP